MDAPGSSEGIIFFSAQIQGRQVRAVVGVPRHDRDSISVGTGDDALRLRTSSRSKHA